MAYDTNNRHKIEHLPQQNQWRIGTFPQGIFCCVLRKSRDVICHVQQCFAHKRHRKRSTEKE
ncbi:hypothetical protein NECAME_15696 [Necator americanus]|uniref:Uncharacterized protein n=1 Tax=Necator americanus TaxID=51031 RepID=W2SIJ3_NECAM|nr:hypothetical protein NECAME_15696 [Necator americanus]ETN68691.1 hypothetical protein NECAME_15696 [Necator americanus]